MCYENNKNKDWFVNQPWYYVENKGSRFAVDREKQKEWEKNGMKVKEGISLMEAQNCIILYTDEDKPWQFWAPWCGYFETLNWVEVISSFLDTKKYF